MKLSYASIESPIVSVRIFKSLKSVDVAGTDLKTGNRNFPGIKKIKFNCNRYKKTGEVLADIKSQTGLVTIENQKYSGDISLLTSAGGGCDVVNKISMEDYLSSLLSKEMNKEWPIEALKAQAIAARSYAMNRMSRESRSFDLESSEKDQVSGDFFDSSPKTILASKETEGEVLIGVSGKIVPGYFHAKCGGRTLRPDQVWNNVEEGFKSVNCPFCLNHGPKSWNQKLQITDIKNFLKWLKKDVPNFMHYFLVQDSSDNLKVTIYVNDKPVIIEKTLFRKYFGRVMFPSNNFRLISDNENLVVEGDGLGHNVGLCQLGAFALAKMGWNYKKILAHYYPDLQIKKIY